MDFEWRTEEEERVAGTWGEPVAATAPPTHRLPLWTAVLFVPLLLVLGALLARRYVEQRVAATGAAVRHDVLASFNLAQYALDRSDAELYASLLSGRDPAWQEAQQTLFEQGQLIDRQALGLPWQATAPQNVAIHLAPDLQQAEVTSDHAYRVTVGGQGSRTVYLRQTAVFRPAAGQHWLLSPPEAAFWEGWVANQARYLTVTFPRRDSEIASRLTLDLDAKLGELCHSVPDITCPPGFHLQVELDTEPASLVQVADRAAILGRGRDLTLPTPSLVGLPIDDAGYRALYQAYASAVLTAAWLDLLDWQCCQQALVHQLLVERQLSHLGLRPWPLAPADYGRMYTEPVYLPELFYRFWDEPAGATLSIDDHWPLYALVEFLEQAAPATSLATIQGELIQAENHWDWLRRVSANRLPDYGLQLAWLRFVYQRAGASALSPPPTQPAQDLQLLCGGRVPLWSLHRYDPAAGIWSNELVRRYFQAMTPLPDGEGVLLFERPEPEVESHTRLILWRNGREKVLFDRLQTLIRNIQIDPSGQRVLFELNDFSQGAWQVSLLRLDECDPAGCPWHRLPGWPSWSPDGQRTLRVHYTSVSLPVFYRGDADGLALQPLGNIDGAPFWLDNDSYAYLSKDASGKPGVALLVANTAEDVFRTLLQRGELLVTLPPTGRPVLPAGRPSDFYIQAVVASPVEPALLFLSLYDGWELTQGDTYLFSFNRETGELRLRLQTDRLHLSQLRFSPDGRWLAMTGYHPGRNEAMLFLHNVARGETKEVKVRHRQQLLHYNWSADGRWLARSDEGLLHLVALPDDGSGGGGGDPWQRYIVHNLGDCLAPIWVNR